MTIKKEKIDDKMIQNDKSAPTCNNLMQENDYVMKTRKSS